jgi:hypothetical protein
MGGENKNMPLGVTTRANGWETRCMEKEYLHTLMALSFLAIGSTGCLMVKDCAVFLIVLRVKKRLGLME